VGALRGAGNAIVPQVAAVFIRAVMDVLQIGNSVAPPVAAAITKSILGV
jgi:site-specific DNA-cytosine methylase